MPVYRSLQGRIKWLPAVTYGEFAENSSGLPCPRRDKLGLLVWGEMPAPYIYDEEVCQNITAEWQRLVIQHYNHPSLMAWVPVNESWGVDQLTQPQHADDPRLVHYMVMLYHLTKSLDPTRLVVGNDGWHQAETDIVAIHDYTQDADDLGRKYAAFKQDRHSRAFTHGHQILLSGYRYQGQPIMITEYGGVNAFAEWDTLALLTITRGLRLRLSTLEPPDTER